SGLHSFLNAPPHIARDGFALGLGEGCEERSHHFAGHRRSINVLFLEVDADTERFQLSDGFQAFLGIAGKREMDFTRTLSISPLRQSAKSRWKSSRFSADVPVIPSSTY